VVDYRDGVFFPWLKDSIAQQSTQVQDKSRPELMQIRNTDIVLKPSYLHEIYINQQCNSINTTTFQNRYEFFHFIDVGHYQTCYPCLLHYNNNNNNNQAFYSQASWDRLEMKPHKQKKNRYKTKAKNNEKAKGDKKIK
jgi:hypothetical protein